MQMLGQPSSLEGAVEDLRRYTSEFPGDHSARFYFGLAILRLAKDRPATLAGNVAELTAAMDAISLSPLRKDAARGHFLTSLKARRDDNLVECRRELEAALDQWPDWPLARWARAFLFYEEGLSQAALLDSEFVVAHMSADVWIPRTYMLHYAILVDLARYSDAESTLRLALTSFPDHAGLHAMLFSLYSTTGRLDAAEKAAHDLYGCAPNDCRALTAMTAVLLQDSNVGEAAGLVRRAKAHDCPDHVVPSWYWLAVATYLSDIRTIEQIVEQQGFRSLDVGTQWRAIWMYVASGRDDVRDEEKAAELLSLAKTPSQRHTGYWFMEAVRAVVYAANEDSARAVKILDTMLKSKHPLGPDVKERIARLKQKIESGEPVRWNCERKDRPILSWPPLHLGLGVDLSQGFTVSAY